HIPENVSLFSTKAIPSPLGQKPVFPGLRADQHSRMVARRGLIWLQAGANGGEPLFSRLVRALSFMSQSIDLPPSVRLRRRLRSEEGLIILKPPGPGVSHLSAFYDVATAAARLVGGQLYIGRRDALVRYRD